MLQAPPGAGKTTIVPTALLHEPWLGGLRIIMLEPRRLATRAAAHRMAQLAGERIGETIGYRIRRETRVGPHTRVEVVTEGILGRMFNNDPTLEGIGLVIFDEFHERSLHADLGLALALHSQRLVRPDLRLLVMSATPESEPVARLLGGAPVIASEGRRFRVEVRYAPPRSGQKIDAAFVQAVRLALGDAEGDVLGFLPGQAEIMRAADSLAAHVPADVDVYPLFGNLSFEDQDRAIAPSPPGRRKVVLATSIAETSLTIEGVRVVVDAGLSRVPRFSPRTGMTQLETVRVSRAASEQRAGRAGRVAPGTCYRLWAAEEQAHLLPFASPEIVDADLAPLVLELAAAGITTPDELDWLTPPPRGAWAQALELLGWLDALDDTQHVTPHGRAMSALGTHPRLGHMLLRSVQNDDGPLACDIAALLEERDLLRSVGPEHDADLRLRLDLLRAARRRERLPDLVAGMRVEHGAVKRAIVGAVAWRRDLGVARTAEWTEASDAGRILALAFPDRVAQRRPGTAPRYLLRNGMGAAFRDSPTLATEPYVVIAETDGRAPESRIHLAAPLSADELRHDFGDQLRTTESVTWNATSGIRAVVRESLGAMVLREATATAPGAEQVRSVLLETLRREGLGVLGWSDSAARTRERLAFLATHDPAWPDVGDATLLAQADTWLGPSLASVRHPSDLQKLDLAALLLDRVPWALRQRLDALAPTHVVAPTGSRLPVDYSNPGAPVVRVRLQEMFGQVSTPAVLAGRVPLTLHLLSPAHRPVQVTQDLASFWRSSYFDVRKDMKARYPKHPWPEDPLSATPTRRRK